MRDSPAEREEHSGPQCFVVEPGGVLVDGDLGVQEDGYPLREARGGDPTKGRSLTFFGW